LFEVARQQNDYLVALIGMIVPRLSVAATQNPNATTRSVATHAQQGIDKNLAKRGCNVGQYRSASISKADADDATLIEPVKLAANVENPERG
jgi:hypothetical protein